MKRRTARGEREKGGRKKREGGILVNRSDRHELLQEKGGKKQSAGVYRKKGEKGKRKERRMCFVIFAHYSVSAGRRKTERERQPWGGGKKRGEEEKSVPSFVFALL